MLLLSLQLLEMLLMQLVAMDLLLLQLLLVVELLLELMLLLAWVHPLIPQMMLARDPLQRKMAAIGGACRDVRKGIGVPLSV
mmetsp:Transcript_4503/g.9023  ORF Transcript_4503/g.9023 Transcript_4503/m.9023 type:complete len:82 (-) Transcript_4503:721-966(-)